MHAMVVTKPGGPEAMSWSELPDPQPGSGDAVIDVAAAGVNFIDTYHRSGLYPMALPFTPGAEGSGTVAAVGEGVETVAVGDRVAWTGSPGSYATRAVVDAESLLTVDDNVDLIEAAAVPIQGMTAHYLAHDTFPLEPGHRCLVHAAAGGTGRLLVQMAKRLGAEVFATVGTPEKADLARSAGADHVINYREEDFTAAIEAIAGPRPLDVVYDGVGATTFQGGLALLRARGMMVTFGNASGPVEPVSPLALSEGSLYLTRPRLWDYISTRAALTARADEVFGWLTSGQLELHIGHRMPVADAVEAHRMLEARATTGKVLLTT